MLKNIYVFVPVTLFCIFQRFRWIIMLLTAKLYTVVESLGKADLILNALCSNVAITWFCKHLSYSTTEAFFGQLLHIFKAGFDNNLAGPVCQSIMNNSSIYNIKSGEINVWWSFYSYLGCWISRMDFMMENQKTGMQACTCHVPSWFDF